MSNRINPESATPITLLPPAADAAGRTGPYRSLKNAKKAYAVVQINQGNAATVALSFEQATAVAGTAAKAFDAVKRIWATENDGTAALARQANAAGYTTTAAQNPKVVVFEIDPTQLDVANGFDCIAITTGASNAANITAAVLFIDNKYAEAEPPTAFTN
jgi:hypothetical protein